MQAFWKGRLKPVCRRSCPQKGVSLIETLVAFAVLGLVIGSVLMLVAQNTRFTSTLYDRTYASIAAGNVMTQELLRQGSVVETGEREGVTDLYGRAWPYRITVVESTVRDVFRVDVDVMDAESGQVLAGAVTLRKMP